MIKKITTHKKIQPNDLAIWTTFKQGDKEAYAQIYESNIQYLLNYGYRIAPDKEVVHDAIQDLFVTIWNNRENLSNTDNIRFYLFRSLRNNICRILKKDCFGEILDNYSEVLSENSFEDLWIENDLANSHKKQLQILFQKLSSRQKEAINLRFYQNFSNEEVANLMGINYQSACKLIYSSLKFLKEKINISSITWFIMTQLEINNNIF